MTALSPASVALLRACADRWTVEGVLEVARWRRTAFTDTRGALPEKENLDALTVFSAIPEMTQNRGEHTLPPELVIPPSQLRQLLAREQAKRVNWAVKLLPLPEKRVVRMRYWEELSLRQIAPALDLSTTRVSQLHQQALGRLRRWLVLWWFVGGPSREMGDG